MASFLFKIILLPLCPYVLPVAHDIGHFGAAKICYLAFFCCLVDLFTNKLSLLAILDKVIFANFAALNYICDNNTITNKHNKVDDYETQSA